MTINAYPLQWPQGWKRTASGDRRPATFNRWAVHQVQEHEAIVPGEPEAPNVRAEARPR